MAAGREVAGLRKDGSRIAVEIEWRPIQTLEGRFVLASVVDITDRRRVQDAERSALEQQLEFERFVAELSFQFINLPGDEITEAIRTGLRRISEAFDLDRCSFFRIDPDGVLFDAVNWTAPESPSVEAPFTASDTVPRGARAVAQRRAGAVLDGQRDSGRGRPDVVRHDRHQVGGLRPPVG